MKRASVPLLSIAALAAFLLGYVPYWGGGLGALASIVGLWALLVGTEVVRYREEWRRAASSVAADARAAGMRDAERNSGRGAGALAAVRLSFALVFSTLSSVPLWAFMLFIYREIAALTGRSASQVSPVVRGLDLLVRVGHTATAILAMLMLTRTRLGVLHVLMPWLPWATIFTAIGTAIVGVGVEAVRSATNARSL